MCHPPLSPIVLTTFRTPIDIPLDRVIINSPYCNTSLLIKSVSGRLHQKWEDLGGTIAIGKKTGSHKEIHVYQDVKPWLG